MDDMDEIYAEFLIEVNEVLDQFDGDMVELEKDPTSRPLLDRIFRGIHTIKGTSGVLGLEKLVSVSHVGETYLSKLRDGQIQLDPRSTTVLLAMSDGLRQILGCFAQTGNEGDGDFSSLIASLNSLVEVQDTVVPTPSPAQVEKTVLAAVSASKEEISIPQAPKVEVAAVAPPQDMTVDPPSVPAKTEGIKNQKEISSEGTTNTIRVDVGLLDKLMNLVGELVLARNQIMQFTAAQSGTPVTTAAQRLNIITAELQSGVMKTRMQPIGTIWHKLPRVLRDLALACGKEVELVMEGADTELDRTILEAIKDPLTHIIRNSVDHGIETPEVRRRKGKNPIGTLTLRAYHEGGKVNIEIRDDGSGIDLEAVKRKAIDRKLVTAADAAHMTERELLGMLFQPGFSTAKEVTNISGRGVGMDVVKTNIAKIGGTVDLHFIPENGTTLKIKIPLTLAIIPALIVSSANNRFAIPQVSLLELVRLESAAAAKAIEYIHNAPVYRLRGTLLPIVYLDRQLDVNVSENRKKETITIVVLQAEDRAFGVVVDEVNDSQEIVVKPLGNILKDVNCFSGATIMGDGRVALILDVVGLAQKAGVLGEQRTRTTITVAQKTESRSPRDEWLLVQADRKGHWAIPLSRVDRLEEFPSSVIEWSGDRQVVQYRGEIMPVISIAELLGIVHTPEAGGTMQVVVVSHQGRRVGLIVETIADIVEEHIELDKTRRSALLLGSAVIEKRVADVINIDAIIDAALCATKALETMAG